MAKQNRYKQKHKKMPILPYPHTKPRTLIKNKATKNIRQLAVKLQRQSVENLHLIP
jgi:glucuronate isomerase